MYIDIAKYANNALPSDVIQNPIFKMYRVKRKNFPKKHIIQLKRVGEYCLLKTSNLAVDVIVS